MVCNAPGETRDKARATVYLGGAIVGVTPEEARGWRQEAASILNMAGFEVLDPTEGKDLEHPALYSAEEIVETDLSMVEKADILLVEVKRRDIPYIGTAMEVRHAWQNGKTIMVWGCREPGYWLQYHATYMFGELNEAIAFILNTFGPFGAYCPFIE